MNEQFRVAQVTGAGNSNSASPPRIFKLTKPFADQAVVLNLGYDQKVQVDFSAIANEKITLVHIGEKLIILFDNHSTVTVEPFFDSRHDQLGNLTIQVAPGRDLTVAEFASAFPIITDSSVLPAAGDSLGQNNAQASGANFSAPIVDPLPPVPTNILAGPEDLPRTPDQPPTGFIPQTPIPPAPTIALGTLPELVVDESFLTSATNGIDGSTPDSASTVASGVLSVTLNVPGGQQSLTFALSISAPGVDTGLIDSQTGNHVFLFLENGVVVGREGKDAAAAASGPQDFTLSVDASGKLTLTDLRSVHEGSGEDGDVSEGTHVPAGLVSLTVTVTDNSSQSASASIDVGPHLTLQDDGPSIHVVLDGEEQSVPNLFVDESNLTAATNGIDGSTPTGINAMTAWFGGIFQAISGADGVPDSEHPISYALSIDVSKSSGLVDAQTGEAVVLVMNGTTVEGHTAASDLLVFTLSVDSNGFVTFTDNRAVKEADGTSPDLNEGISIASGAVTLTATIIDNDGDTASASIDLGPQVTFYDDGPAVTATVDREAQVVLDEGNTNAGAPPVSQAAAIALPVGYTAGDDGDVSGTGYISTASSGSALVTINPVFGADGPAASGSISYALSAVAGNSGVTLTDGTQVDLVQASATLVLGVVTGTQTVAFAISMDGTTGVVTVEQYLSLHNPTGGSSYDETTSLTNSTLSVIVTVTDGDADTASSNAVNVGSQILFHDDGPAVTASLNVEAQVVLDEGNTNAGSPPTSTPATLVPAGYTAGNDGDVSGTGYISTASSGSALVSVNPAFGADGPAVSGSTSYALSAVAGNSGVTLTDGTQVDLVQISSTLVLGVVAGQPTTVAFAISMDSTTGVVTVEQYLSLHNPTGGSSYDETTSLTNGALSVIVTVTDGDADTASSNAVNVGSQILFHDDGPAVTASLNVEAQVVLDEGNTNAGSPPTSTPATLVPAGYTAGNDLDVAGTGYISTASSGSALVTINPAFGADGPAASGSTSYALAAVAGASGVTLTDGTQVDLVQISSTLVLGVVAGQPTTVAFAISMDGTTGVVTVEQYLSLHNPTGGTSYDETTSLTNGALSVIVTVTDGDADTASSNAVNVGSQILFHDDGPAVTASVNASSQV
ncbi:DUF5801 repeats-in-toxin domain-containing protein, partial [Bradyrhizobium iriomotense]|uniref:DUF5801 repeats-in-toxin domain-containing protein n=1 Tax=Bradyrhizobium iriomotense TaxID=441950 RepID=UPI001FEFCCA4